MRLTQQQFAHFHTFGFLVFRQLLSPEEMAQYSQQFNAGLDSWLDEPPYDGQTRHYGSLMEEHSPFIAGLADDPRFGDVAEQLLGKPALGIAVDGNYLVGDTGWHPDTASLDYSGVKFCIYPDPLEADNGALRVIPGSHREPLHSSIERDPQTAYDLTPEQMPAYAFASQPGDVLVFNVGLWHAAFGGKPGRRQGVVVYYEDPDTAAATEAIVDQMHGNQKHFSGLGQPMYGSYWRGIADARHQRWLARLDELGVLETPAAAV